MYQPVATVCAPFPFVLQPTQNPLYYEDPQPALDV